MQKTNFIGGSYALCIPQRKRDLGWWFEHSSASLVSGILDVHALVGRVASGRYPIRRRVAARSNTAKPRQAGLVR
jgi:hypothetical protein